MSKGTCGARTRCPIGRTAGPRTTCPGEHILGGHLFLCLDCLLFIVCTTAFIEHPVVLWTIMWS